MTPPTILIAGGGIGGLTAGLALKQKGFGVIVCERADRLRAVGAGITMQSNAMLAFAALGIAAQVQSEGFVMTGGCIGTASGRRLAVSSLQPVTQALGAPSVAIHRGRLLNILAHACTTSGIDMRTGLGVLGFDAPPSGEGVLAKLSDGSTLEAAVLVGCDGLHSAIRTQLHGQEPPRYAGYTSWRGIAPQSQGDTDWAGEFWGNGQRFGVVPIGHNEIYWFAVQDAPQHQQDGPDPRSELLDRFQAWHPALRGLIERTPSDAILRTDCCDRPPMTKTPWGRDHITLLGDAAHPMTPNLGQGGAQAVEDALVLARCLSTHPAHLPTALRAYEAERQPRTRFFVERSAAVGRFAHWRSAPARWLRDVLMRLTPASAMHRQLIRSLRPSL